MSNKIRYRILGIVISFFVSVPALMAESDPTGWALQPLPLVSASSDDGFGYGLRVYGTYKDAKAEPYKYQIYGQYYATTRGYEFHELSLDAVDFLDSSFRIITRIGVERTLNAQWYGTGNFQDIQRQKRIKAGEMPINENVRTDPSTGEPIRDLYTFEDYGDSAIYSLNTRALLSPNSGDFLNPGRKLLKQTQGKYFYYDRIRPFIMMSTEQWIGDSNFKWFVGLRGQRYKIQSYAGDFEAGDKLPNGRTLIDIEQPLGYDATQDNRFVNGVRGALIYDSRPRKREINPNAGVFADIHVEGVGKGTGSHYSFTRYTAAWRQYIELLPGVFNPRDQELVFAYRFLGQKTTGDVPFYEMGRIYTSRESAEGLGGNGGLRGYPANQFVDRVMGMANFEMRLTTFHWNVLGGIDFIFLGYYDLGRVAPTNREMTLKGLHRAYGGGVRLLWQENVVINISYGRSQFESNFNFGFNHMF
ncbi:MAG: hypothetical protein KDK23_01750 [Leptospiraceae bacterium]|nr:hypothetical protein [Leptospiraceae bacterium]